MRAGPSAPFWQAVVTGEQETSSSGNDGRVATWGVYRQTYVGA